MLAIVGPTCLAGIILGQFSLSSYPTSLSSRKLTPFLAGLLITLGLISMSVTHDAPDSAQWCAFFWRVGRAVFPQAAQREIHKTWGSIGSFLLATGIIISPHARQVLSTKPLTWLGNVSFPVFLLHPLFMQTVMPFFAFSSEYFMVQLEVKFDPDTGSQTFLEVPRFKQRGNGMLGVGIVVTLACTLAVSHLWIMKVEPVFGKFTKWSEDVMTGKHEVHWILPRSIINRQATGTTTNVPRVPSEALTMKEGHVS